MRPRLMFRWLFALLVLGPLLLLLFDTQPAPQPPVALRVLTISDWHGQLDPLNVDGVGSVGGAAALSAYFRRERSDNANTLTFTAGDAFGAAPPLSHFFEDVPTLLAMRLMGFDADTLGNHNFDRGIAHLQRIIDLARAAAGEQLGSPFQHLSANLKNRNANLRGVEDFALFVVAGVKIGVIGLTNPEASTLVFPGNLGTIEPTDPVPAAENAREAARKAGAQVFVALIHAGITGFDAYTGKAYGPLIDFADSVSGFNLIVGDHTNFEYSGLHNGALVVENRSKGRTYARIDLTVDPADGRVIDRSVEFVTPLADRVEPDPSIVDMLQSFRAELRPILYDVIGKASVPILRKDACGRDDGRFCESLIGNVATDAMRLRYGTDFALVSAGGLRADLTCPAGEIPADFCPPHTPPPFLISRGRLLTAFPFGNAVVTVDVDGTELKAILENGVSALPAADGRFPQVSGLCFTYDISVPAGSRVKGAVRQAADGSCSGAPVDLSPASIYSLATIDFVANGGDGYPVLSGRSATRDTLDQVLADFVTFNTPLNPSIQGRIVCTASGRIACPEPTS